jgi:hypothetical protein
MNKVIKQQDAHEPSVRFSSTALILVQKYLIMEYPKNYNRFLHTAQQAAGS